MKKSAKKSSQNKRVAAVKPAAKRIVKTVGKAISKTLAKAMAPKAAKKPLTKKPAPAPKAAPAKHAKAEPAKLDKKALKGAPAAKPAVAAPAAPAGKKGKGAPAPAAPAVQAKGPAGKAGKSPKADVAKAGKGAKEGAPKEKSAAAIRAAEAAGEKLCREAGCENIATTKGYCRLDYIKNWKKIKRKEMILKEGKLNQYIEELVSKYPDKYIDIIRQDLSTEVNFNKIIHDLELDESIDDLEYDGDSIDSLIGAISKSSDEIDDGDF